MPSVPGFNFSSMLPVRVLLQRSVNPVSAPRTIVARRGAGQPNVHEHEHNCLLPLRPEPHLLRQIVDHGNEDACSYCARHAGSFPLHAVADRLEKEFIQHYKRTSLDPTAYESALAAQSGSPWSLKGTPVVEAIAAAAEVPSDVAADVQRILESRHFDEHADRVGEGTEFEGSIASQARFFGHHAKELLTAVFANIDDTGKIAVGGGEQPILDLDPAAHLKSLPCARVAFRRRIQRCALPARRPPRTAAGPIREGRL